jgi:hypothetical protein
LIGAIRWSGVKLSRAFSVVSASERPGFGSFVSFRRFVGFVVLFIVHFTTVTAHPRKS